ncbi:hypothetical protein BT93_C1486 [Corymbia citriodora subsp. variegata]|nr:hypothetical protein BT93_C1486 [Corymbia citriodora subsp. variegata]
MEKLIFLAFLDVLLASLLMFQPTICSSNFTDQDALLHFKLVIEVNLTNTIKGGNWTVMNSLTGGIPTEFGAFPKLQQLNLSSNDLRGQIPSFLGNLSFLASLDLRNNSFNGTILTEIGRLQRLKELVLESNQFEGNIPPNLGQCQNLEVMSLAMNRLTGGIPTEFGAFPNFLGNISTLQVIILVNASLTGSIPSALLNISLTWVNLTNNYLSGSLPSDLCYRWPNIKTLSLRYNQFSGLLPETLNQCKELIILWLSYNCFQGSIPRDIGSLQKLQKLFVAANNLTGMIPRTIGNMSSLHWLDIGGSDLSLPNLEELYLQSNGFGGNILQCLSNFSNLILFDAGENQLSGPIPSSLGNLKKLIHLSVESNQLTGDTHGSEIGFLSALSNCQSLQALWLEDNPLRGSIPESVKNFSNSLQILFARNCEIRGRIPEELELSNNALYGNIPSSIGGLECLQRLYLDNNHLEGPIPDEICNLTGLGELFLHQNRLSGSIPNCIENLSSLQKLFISSNNMTSAIPNCLWSLQDLIFLNLSLNSFNGGLPLEIGKMRALENIDLSWNKLTGAITSSILELESLTSLNLSRNSFQGSIPQSIGNLKGLDFLDLSYNDLSGVIPKSMEGITYLQNLNLSFNKLSREIPNGRPFRNFSALSFIGNEALCGNANFQVPRCRVNGKKSSSDKQLHLLYIMVPIISATLLVSIICLLRKHGKIGKNDPVSVENPPRIDHPMISYRELCSATNNFAESNLLGVGSYSSVYKGTLTNETDIAIKVLNLHIESALKSFDKECEVFRKIRHRNLVKVISSYTNADLRALMLQYMPNGSLEKWLYFNNYNLVKIMVDVATALDYLHHGQEEPIVHCHLKPSNILLNEDMVAQVYDFGIAKIVAMNKLETQTQTLEYGLKGKVSTKGDVYSFGILLLEVITIKKPTDEMFNAHMSLTQWVSAAVPDKVLDIVDSKLLSMNHQDLTLSELESIVLLILELGLECSKNLPKERTDMKTVMVKLNKIKLSLPGQENKVDSSM